MNPSSYRLHTSNVSITHHLCSSRTSIVCATRTASTPLFPLGRGIGHGLGCTIRKPPNSSTGRIEVSAHFGHRCVLYNNACANNSSLHYMPEETLPVVYPATDVQLCDGFGDASQSRIRQAERDKQWAERTIQPEYNDVECPMADMDTPHCEDDSDESYTNNGLPADGNFPQHCNANEERRRLLDKASRLRYRHLWKTPGTLQYYLELERKWRQAAHKATHRQDRRSSPPPEYLPQIGNATWRVVR